MSWAEAKWIVDNTTGKIFGGFQEFTTPGAFSFTVPEGVTVISITACGGGGGGHTKGSYSYSGASFGSGGGGGAAVFGLKHTVTPGQVIRGTVGAKGAGSGDGYAGNNGKATTINGIITLAGGKGASYDGTPGRPGGPGGGFGGHCLIQDEVANEYSIFPSQPGTNGVTGAGGGAGSFSGGGGGGGSLGAGGAGDMDYEDASSPIRNGEKGGGGGGGYYASDDSRGGNGGDGYVKFSWGVCMD